MKRASYRDGVDFIAQNDSSGDADALVEYAVGGLVTVVMLAAIFGVESSRVARDVVRRRKQLNKIEARP